jgi:tRNA U34 5-carboxymethylaminomethyl modifying GTPase MnmE/TrmE
MEEKNKLIFMLQQRVGELESKIQYMIALPDYNKEKQEALVEKEKLENKIRQLKNNIKNEKTKNLIFIGLALIFIVIAGFFFIKG